MNDSRLRQTPGQVKVGPFVVGPAEHSSRNAEIYYSIGAQKMWVERADVKDLIAALQKAYGIEP